MSHYIRVYSQRLKAIRSRLMQKIDKGHLRVLTYSHIYNFPPVTDNNKSTIKAELRVVNDVFWIRLCTMGDLGFSEAYMCALRSSFSFALNSCELYRYGDVECDDLVAIFQVYCPCIFLRRHGFENYYADVLVES